VGTKNERDRHHDVHASKLRPHLERAAEEHTAEDAGLEEISVALRTLRLLKVDLLLNFLELEADQLVVNVTLTVKIGEDLKRLLLPAVIDEPTRGLGEEVHAYKSECPEESVKSDRKKIGEKGTNQERGRWRGWPGDPKGYGRTLRRRCRSSRTG
jgi:hypothetical protein